MLDQEVPEPLQHRVISYFDYTWQRSKGVDPKSLFKDAPTCMVAELFFEIAKDMFNAVSLQRSTVVYCFGGGGGRMIH